MLAVLLKSKFFTYLFTVDANDNSSTAWPVTVVNTIMAESLRFMADEIQKKVDSRIPLDDAINSTVIETLKKHYAIVFNGNGYSEEWVVEAGTRGLPILKHPYEALVFWTSLKKLICSRTTACCLLPVSFTRYRTL